MREVGDFVEVEKGVWIPKPKASTPVAAKESAKPKPLNAPLLPNHNDKEPWHPGWYERPTPETVAEIESLQERVRQQRTIETKDGLPITGKERGG